MGVGGRTSSLVALVTAGREGVSEREEGEREGGREEGVRR